MRITFVLPDCGNKPVGGYKVVYEYAGRMAAQGDVVTIAYANFPRVPESWRETVGELRKRARTIIRSSYSCRSWFNLHPGVREILVPDLRPRFIPDGEVVFATSWETAEFVASYPEAKGKKYYLIQHFEDWSGDRDRVLATWTLPLEKIVIAPWLAEIATGLGERSHLIENGLDFTYFTLDRPIASKDRNRVAMLYHSLGWKGSEDGIAALEMARARIPGLAATLFGVPSRPAELPPWIEYVQRPDRETHNRIYNNAAVFVGPSHSEGFGLTPPEAMMCGCAVACTDIGGYRVLARHGETALLSPPRDPKALADNVARLVSDDELRIRIASEAHRRVQEFTWERAFGKMRRLIGNRP